MIAENFPTWGRNNRVYVRCMGNFKTDDVVRFPPQLPRRAIVNFSHEMIFQCADSNLSSRAAAGF